MATRVEELVRALDLEPHPEGGWYREIFRAPARVTPADGRGERPAMTVIHFLLPEGGHSAWHRVDSDEAWHACEGAPLELVAWHAESGESRRTVLGAIGRDARPVAVVPAGWWQAARPLGGYVLAACVVAPGFEFADFALLRDQPALAARLAAAHRDWSAWL